MAFTDDDIAAEVDEVFGSPGQLSRRELEWQGFEATSKLSRQEKRSSLRLALQMGMSIRAAARFAGYSRPSAQKWASKWRIHSNCRCGRPASHRGWCSWRLRLSPARRMFLMSRWGKLL